MKVMIAKVSYRLPDQRGMTFSYHFNETHPANAIIRGVGAFIQEFPAHAQYVTSIEVEVLQ